MATSSVLPQSVPGTPSVVMEVCAALAVVGVTTLGFLLGAIGTGTVAVVTLLILSALTILSWFHFDQGRHPCFLFLASLLVFQGGRFVSFCLTDLADPYRVDLMTLTPFSIEPNQAVLVSWLIVLSAICIYGVCRWHDSTVPPPVMKGSRSLLRYLYLLFFATLPIQTYKNYAYFAWVKEHGGYSAIFVNHEALAATVPWFVRAVSLVILPVFVAIFVLESRRKRVWLVTTLYFASASIILLLGSRMAAFTLILGLWYAARMKSRRPVRMLRLAVILGILILVANLIAMARLNANPSAGNLPGPLAFVQQQGASLQVTEVCVVNRNLFAPYWASYLFHELQSAFVAGGAYNYVPGNMFDADVSNLLNAEAYRWGYGVGGSYVGEAYIIGGLLGVILISILIGYGLRLLYRASGSVMGLFIVTMIFPEIILMPRGDLLGWISVLARTMLSLVVLWAGWCIYRLAEDVVHTLSSTPSSRLSAE